MSTLSILLLTSSVSLAALIASFLLYPPTFLDVFDRTTAYFGGKTQQDPRKMHTDAAISIRNITSTPLQLKSVAWFGRSAVAAVADAAAPKGDVSKAHQSGTTHQEIIESEDVSITVPAFETVSVGKVLGTSGQVRLTVQHENETHFLDLNLGKQASKDLAPASKNAQSRLTAVYYPEAAQVTMFTSSNPEAWMANLRNDTPISALSIPGTHNAAAYHHAFPSVRCQAVSPRTQLLNGVRFFDVRVRVVDPATDRLELVHAVWPVALTGRRWFRALVDNIFAFLDAHPTETVVMTVKREGMGAATDSQLSRVLYDHYASDAARWFTAPRIPYLGEVRGKIVLVRRFSIDDSLRGNYGGEGWCLDASAWADNTPDALTGSGELRVQDFYAVMRPGQIKTKTDYVTGLMAQTSAVVADLPPTATATADAPQPGKTPVAPESESSSDSVKQPVFINFLSASNFFNPWCWPEGIAARLNPHVLEYLCLRHNQPGEDGRLASVGDGCTGIVVCDWVGHKGNWDLVKVIVGWNARLVAREQGKIQV